ncbi:PaaI family thioesterase [Flavisphingomonas formosensis]|uniref:PaaI family thioesterase n=1 Tax=Flavisphingomonas formosensis TaxID=861534 RepID=UPI0012F9D6B6|nr:PaaI family thioesterase [Sphingomonas formosensis]
MLDTAVSTGYGLWAGVELVEMGDGVGRVAFTPRVEMLTPWGTLNGGVLSSLVEIPAFVALLSTIESGELPVTNDIFIQHMRPLPGDTRYELTGTLIRRSRTMAWLEVAARTRGESVSLVRITKSIIRHVA